MSEVARFEIDYTLWMNIAFVGLAGWLFLLHRQHLRKNPEGGMKHGRRLSAKRVVVYCFMVLLAGGLIVYLFAGDRPGPENTS